MSDYHEPVSELSGKTRDYVRALNSLKEEIEAVDWYQQRVDVTEDAQLKAVLEHNRDEEIEHACMTLEWLRRNMPGWDEELRENLFKDGDIAAHGEHGDEEKENDTPDSIGLGIGKIKS
jgi:ferritin-like protein